MLLEFMRKFLLLILWVLTCLNAFAQVPLVEGFVKSQNGENPIPNVSIVNRFSNAIAVTDKNGKFEIEKSSVEREVLYLKIGDFSQIIQYKEDVNPWIILIPYESNQPKEIDRIETVTIKQNRLKEKLKESPLTIESMSAQSIKSTQLLIFTRPLGI